MQFAKKTILLLLLASAGCTATMAQVTSVPERNLSWAHERSELTPDPAARFGRLANGMRYVIYPNRTPPGEVSLRFRFDVGSMHEAEDQRGLAHFIEHMAFNGTRNVPEGEMVKMLERHGLAFGNDTQATTSLDQTVYRLDVPAATEAKLDTAFLLMRELASEILMEPAAIDRERGIILSEARFRDIPLIRAYQARTLFLHPGQIYSARPPIGDPEVIRSAQQERFLDLYRRYYRPERATLIVAGDVEPSKMEAEIRRRFSDWRAVGEAGADPDYGTIAQRPFDVGSLVEPGVLNNVTGHWLRPFEEAPLTRAQVLLEFRTHLVHQVLSRRLKRLVDAGGAPFTAADVRWSKPFRSAEITAVSVDPVDGGHAKSLAIVEQEVRRAVQHGIHQSELDQAATDLRTQLATAAARAGTRRTAQLADELLAHVQQDAPIISSAQTLSLFEESVGGFPAEKASALLKERFQGSGPLVFAMAGAPIAGGDAALAQAYSAAQQVAVGPLPAMQAKAWRHTDYGPPGTVTQRTELADIGATSVRFANGVTLLVRPTSSKANEVLVTARFGGGRLAMPQGLATLPLTQGEGAFIGGGLMELTSEEMRQTLSGKTYSARFSIEDEAFALQGATDTSDLATQLQVLAAYSTAPAWRPEIFEQKKAEVAAILGYVDSMPLNVATTQMLRLLRSGDDRGTLPTREELAATTLQSLRARIDPSLQQGPVEVVIVGDVTVSEAIRQTALTFGALPARNPDPPRLPGADQVRFPSRQAQPHRISHSGSANAAVGLVAWPTNDFHSDPREARVRQILNNILRGRALEKIREELGVAYSPVTANVTSETFADFGYLSILAEVDPTKLEPLMDAIFEVAESVKSQPVSEDELSRAVQPMLEALQRDRAANEYWRTALRASSWDQRRLEIIRSQEATLRSITPADIQRVARKYLLREAAYRLLVEPRRQ